MVDLDGDGAPASKAVQNDGENEGEGACSKKRVKKCCQRVLLALYAVETAGLREITWTKHSDVIIAVSSSFGQPSRRLLLQAGLFADEAPVRAYILEGTRLRWRQLRDSESCHASTVTASSLAALSVA